MQRSLNPKEDFRWSGKLIWDEGEERSAATFATRSSDKKSSTWWGWKTKSGRGKAISAAFMEVVRRAVGFRVDNRDKKIWSERKKKKIIGHSGDGRDGRTAETVFRKIGHRDYSSLPAMIWEDLEKAAAGGRWRWWVTIKHLGSEMWRFGQRNVLLLLLVLWRCARLRYDSVITTHCQVNWMVHAWLT